MLVGTNTVEVDDPELTARDEVDEPAAHQPLRVVMGARDLDPGRRIFNDRAETLHLRTRDPREALAELHGLGRRHVFRSEEHTSELQSLMRISYAVFCLKKKNNT